jgi:hypothetical protein
MFSAEHFGIRKKTSYRPENTCRNARQAGYGNGIFAHVIRKDNTTKTKLTNPKKI